MSDLRAYSGDRSWRSIFSLGSIVMSHIYDLITLIMQTWKLVGNEC